jgi:hypothetical protein
MDIVQAHCPEEPLRIVLSIQYMLLSKTGTRGTLILGLKDKILPTIDAVTVYKLGK